MERLEAALSKARELRKTTMSEPGQVRRPGERAPQPAGADWLSFPEITISEDQAHRQRIPALLGGKDAVPYDMLRSRTIRMMKEKGWTRLAVTSPDAACGKTTVSANLALSLSRQRDLRVILIDLDLRRPGLARVLGHSPSRSFWTVLEGGASFEEQGVRYGENLLLGLNSEPGRNPAELLQSVRTREVLDGIEQRWRPDIILFDMSPMLATDDNVGFLGNVDCAILVAAAENTRMTSIDACEKELAQLTNVLGIVLNKCRYPDTGSGYASDAS